MGALPAPDAAAQTTTDRDYERFLQEIETPGAQYVAISYHFRHDVGCTSRGCIIMGPMTDRHACEGWAREYNRIDPTDHARCVEASDYDQVRY